MSASAKPTEKLFKSFLAAVLAISLCPLMPAEKAQAEETGDSGEQADAAQMSDESLDRDADPTEGALAADGSDADPELAGENDGAEAHLTIAMSPYKQPAIQEPQSSTGPNAAPANG